MNIATKYFPIFVLIASVFTLLKPELFVWFSGNWITFGLGLIMLGMGVTLEAKDFTNILKSPFYVFIGVLLQFTIMPLLGWSIGLILNLPTFFAVGLILVASCPGGTASNVITYIARGDLALSVTMTSVSTLFSVIATPILTWILAGNKINVNALGLFISTIQVVVFPVFLGVLLNKILPFFTKKIRSIFVVLAVACIVLIVASVIGSSRKAILSSGWKLVVSVFLLHFLGFLLGYIFSKIFTKNEIVSRTVSIEVGMQNSGLGVVLAKNNFSDPLVAVPSAISSLFHSLIASVLASYWQKKEKNREKFPFFKKIFVK
ncbi:MAG: bile acid:sodium symporter family protein [Leptospiraceae bacterium]|nr:bile acid:sodium symporter family protein [Leptospiraceae bacterium]MCK6380788.1 bile acid:sodium symporter family protein [Leptospiraceae bacterium]NUM40495.1 bile acid:sodium symporter family protein [Leptospiraceae bacterium]